jgi:thiosulfate dehydrogenase
MRNWVRFLIAGLVFLLAGVGVASASHFQQVDGDDVSVGAQLFDKWYARLNVSAPEADHPLWERQTSNTRSGAETWRCAECHGWDYQGAEGAYGAGSHYTGFPGVLNLAATLTEDEIVAHLNGKIDPQHDFSAYMDQKSLRQLAVFLKEGLTDDRQYIDPVSLKVLDGSPAKGKKLFETVCAACHGVDGKTITFRGEGVNEYLGDVTKRDPYRFLHRSRFGVAGTAMPIGRELGWSIEDSRDGLAYAQTLPGGQNPEPIGGAGAASDPAPQVGGPTPGLFGISILFIAGFGVFVGAIVFILSKRK